MAQLEPGTPPQAHPSAQDASARPKVRLATWVNVVLVLTLLFSCSHVDRSEVDSDEVARQVAYRLEDTLDDTRSSSLTADDVTQLCRLLAAVAVEQGLKPSTILGEDLETACDDGARGR